MLFTVFKADDNSPFMKEWYKNSTPSVAWLSLGNILSYLPFTMMIKMSSEGLFSGMNGASLSLFTILPVYSVSLTFAVFSFISLAGWWKYSSRTRIFGIDVPRPRSVTFLSGLCGIGHIITVMLAYSLSGISIVFAALLMKGGVLTIAPLVDTVVTKRKRKIYWPSWVAAFLSLMALIISFSGQIDIKMTMICFADILLFFLFYFSRLYLMSNWAKTQNNAERKRYFVEEVFTTNIGLMVILLVLGLVGSNFFPNVSVLSDIWTGISEVPRSTFVRIPLLIGLFSAFIGIFTTLVHLDRRENTFCVCANQSTSLISGTAASYLMALFYGNAYPEPSRLVGASIVVMAIIFLTFHKIIEKRALKKLTA